MPSVSKTLVLDNCISVKDADEYSGYSSQYLRRLLRQGKLVALKLGQLWLIEMKFFESYLAQTGSSKDHRFGPKLFFVPNCLQVITEGVLRDNLKI